MDKKKLLEFRETCIKLVLATDMMFHFAHVKELKQLIDLNTEVSPNNDNKVINFSSILTPTNKLMIMKMLMHMCDVSNPLKNEKLSQIWGQRCVMEFFIQGDKEKKLGYPLASELFDRDVLNYHKSQVGF